MGSLSTGPDIVLISGINGYIAAHIALKLLKKGYIVRGTSRSMSAKDQLLNGPFRDYQVQYQHYEVLDISANGAFDEAVRGVHGIIHTASPVDFNLTSLDQFIGPAVNGNLSILDSAKRCAGPQLTSFVVTSSIAAIHDKYNLPPDHDYSETDWNTSGEEVARKDYTAPVAYGASKTAAERSVWRWAAENKPSFACAAINPGVVTGPPVNWPSTPEKLNLTLLPVWKIYAGTATEIPPMIGAATYVDVRDVADMHIWAMEHPEQSNGQRYLVANGKAPPQATADLLRKTFPDRDIILGEPGKAYVADGTYAYVPGETSTVASKAKKALGGREFIGFEQSILDTVTAFELRWPGLAKNFKN